ncbi:MAG: hypothetical protein BGO98_11350 [Myxococcales bacterium 68-20]|nr:SUMF1/EgtB/PvdO family nonheme iron enzyme [Myxococcales bacterium]OJY16783.1 MAG: hypothetical protein BGO98_11350 [Myxococcales bacterium 68-20]
MARSRLLIGGICAVFVCIAACTSFGSAESPAPEPSSDGGGGEEGQAPGTSDASGPDGNIDVPPGGDAGSGMIVVIPGPGGFAIDSHEVTVAQYTAFQIASAGFDSGIPRCAWRMTYAPAANCPLDARPDVPMTCVDWCSAAAYCAWADARLCGRIGGGAATSDTFTDPALNEWTRACTGGPTADRWCYGDEPNTTACNTTALDVGALSPVGKLAACVGGVDGLHDMSGNAWEWTNGCNENQDDPSNDGCPFRGGGYRGGLDGSKCAVGSYLRRGAALQDIGFRCCKSL